MKVLRILINLNPINAVHFHFHLHKIILIVSIILSVLQVQVAFSNVDVDVNDDVDFDIAAQPLFLTPFIKQGRSRDARELSLVTLNLIFRGITIPHIQSYSGYITVNEIYNSNLFFWFVHKETGWKNAPVILWLDGGPGLTVLNSFFNMHGPYKFIKAEDTNNRLELTTRNNSWHKEYNMIYLDNPVGVGFSFTDDENGYANSGVGTAPEIYEFLKQFLKMFPSLRGNELYIGGVSYGGTYGTSLAHYIHQENENHRETETANINLKGLILDSPWMSPIDQVDFGKVLYAAGLIGLKDKEGFEQKRKFVIDLIRKERFPEAANTWLNMVLKEVPKATGFQALGDITDMEFPSHVQPHHYDFTDFISADPFRQAIHVGSGLKSRRFQILNPKVQDKMMGNFMNSVKHLLEDLLNGGGYKVLIYVGNFDIITSHQGIIDMVQGLELDLNLNLGEFERKIWKYDKESKAVSGYVTSSSSSNDKLKLELVVVRNAPHAVGIFKQDEVLQLVNNFIKGDDLGVPISFKRKCQ